MDALLGYNQIKMHKPDHECSSFTTDRETYYYQVMPFGLKNAGRTYHRLVNLIFQEQIGSNMEIYVDDLRDKSRESLNHVMDLSKAFSVLRAYKMHLNPVKCALGVSSRKFLEFLISKKEKSKPTQKKSMPFWKCDLQKTSKSYNSSQDE